MLISHQHRFAFIHVPKTGGSSVTFALWPHADHVDRHWMNRGLALIGIHVNHYAPWRQRRFRPHTSAATLQRHLPAAVFADLFKFAFVRNPWDLLVSYYHFLLAQDGRRGPSHHRHRLAASLPDFESYLRYEVRRGRISQSRMVTDRRGRLLVDFLGRYESLTADFTQVCRHIGLDAGLEWLNSSGHRDYREFYTPRLVGLVRDHFAEDVELFGYGFENGPAAAAPPPAGAGAALAWAG